jgi:hypothetical protein
MIYFLQSGIDGPIKIGTTAGKSRVKELQTYCPYPARLIATIDGGRSIERRIHLALRGDRSNGEWFKPTNQVVRLAFAAQQSSEDAIACLTELEQERLAETEALVSFEQLVRLLLAASLEKLVQEHSVGAVAKAICLSDDALLKLRKGVGSTSASRLYSLKQIYPDALRAMDALLFDAPLSTTVRNLETVTTVESARDAIDALLARLSPRDVA